MKSILLFLCLGMASCISYPSITERLPDGSIVRYSAGMNVMGRQSQIVAEVTGPGGRRVRFMNGESDATEVPKSAIAGNVAKSLAGTQAGVTNLKTKTDGAVAVEGIKAKTAETGILSGERVTLGTFVKPK